MLQISSAAPSRKNGGNGVLSDIDKATHWAQPEDWVVRVNHSSKRSAKPATHPACSGHEDATRSGTGRRDFSKTEGSCKRVLTVSSDAEPAQFFRNIRVGLAPAPASGHKVVSIFARHSDLYVVRPTPSRHRLRERSDGFGIVGSLGDTQDAARDNFRS